MPAMKISEQPKVIIFFLIIAFASLIILNMHSLEEITLFAADSALVDSSKVELNSFIIDSLSYSGDSIHYSIENEYIKLSGNSTVKYHNSKLNADSIVIDMKEKQAFASGKAFMKDADQNMLGDNISYDLDSEWGMVATGCSEFDKGFYYGDEIRKIDEEIFDVDNGLFTTCDAYHPHFNIKSKKLRLYKNDKIVAKPIVFYVNHFPIMMFPFGTFTIKRGRQSGILVPSPGWNKTNGKYIENIAYYFAYRDYADVILAYDYMEKTGWELNLTSNYIKRYKFDGKFKATLQKTKEETSDKAKYEWEIDGKHHQDFGNESTFDANLNFVSSKNVWSGSDILDERLKEKITSTMSYKMPDIKIYSKYNDDLENENRDVTFSATKYSFLNSSLQFSMKYDENYGKENSDYGNKNITFPSLSYSLSSPVYELFLDEDAKISEESWWKNISFSYRMKAIHEGKIVDADATIAEIIYEAKGDSIQHNAGLKNSLNLSYSYKYKGWLNLSQTISSNATVFDKDTLNIKFAHGYDYSTTSKISFNLYGLRKFPKFYLRAIRHIISPSMNFVYNPDFSVQNGNFYNFGGIGLSTNNRRKKISFSLGNKWQIKLAETKNQKERKINDFLTITTTGFSYDFEENGNGFNENILHSICLNPNAIKYKFIDISLDPAGSMNQKFYDIYENLDFSIEDWNFSMTSKLKLSNDAHYIDYFPIRQNNLMSDEFLQADSIDANDAIITTLAEFDELEREKKNWSISFSHIYKTNKLQYENNDYTSNIRTSISAKITKNWSISYENYIDLKEDEFVSHNFTITRNLHCWKIFFRYTKQRDYWSYRLQLFNIELPDALKFRTSDHKR